MPDMPSLSLAIIGLYLFLCWTDNDQLKFLLAAALVISLSILIKLPSIIIGAPLLYLTVTAVSDRRISFKDSSEGPRAPLHLRRLLRWDLWLFAAIALLPSAVWYWHAYEIAQKFYPHHLFGAGGLQLMSGRWYLNIARETIVLSLTPVLVSLAVLYPCTRGSSARAGCFHAWVGAMILFIVIVGYGNRHPWYRLPLAPICAAYAGATCAWIGAGFSDRFKFRATAMVIVLLFAVLVCLSTKELYYGKAANLRLLGMELRRITPENSLVVAADYGDPTVFYYAERRGWHFMEKNGIYNGHPTGSAEAIADLEALKARGATHFVVYSGTVWWLDYYKEFAQHLEKTADVIKTGPQFEIFRLNRSKQ
jgi:4-amino-4-deoxy-L-arabinose transferase-like glycosyltransferase